MNNEIHILTFGGLGNRLSSLAGGLTIAEIYDKTDITVHWFENPACGVAFENIFNFSKIKLGSKIIHKDWEETEGEDRLVLETYPNSVYYGHEPNSHTLFVKVRENHYRELAKYRNKIWIYESNLLNFYISIEDQIEIFKQFIQFKKDLVDEAHEFIKTNNISKKTLGIHLRRTTDFSANTILPIDLVISSIQKLQNNYENIYISTDTPEVVPEIEQAVGKCNYRQVSPCLKKGDEPFSPTNIWRGHDQVRDAVVDLIILSKTDFKIYSPYSTFAMWATLLSEPIADYNNFLKNGYIREYWR